MRVWSVGSGRSDKTVKIQSGTEVRVQIAEVGIDEI